MRRATLPSLSTPLLRPHVGTRQAAIDIGSNSIQMTVVEVGENGQLKVLDRIKDPAQLRLNLNRHGRFSKEVMSRVSNTLAHFVEVAQAHNAPLVAFATATLRAAVNTDELLANVRSETGLEIKVLSGSEEGRLVYAGVCGGMPHIRDKRDVCVDVGGGSTEIVLGAEARCEMVASVALGTLVVHKRLLNFDIVGPKEAQRAAQRISRRFILSAEAIGRRGFKHAIGTGGSIQRIARLVQGIEGTLDGLDVQGFELTSAQLDSVIAHLTKARSHDERVRLPGMDPERADQLLGGALIYQALGRLWQLDGWIVSMSALRRGMLETALADKASPVVDE